ncbi:MAG: hypothetical protein HY319_23595 [Armatimonadetes bacterium]|nr:hypothetical protein [Armatimonadota bacterium]
MVTVTYDYEFLYPYTETGSREPLLQLRMAGAGLDQWADVDAFLDTGAELTLFDGEISRVIGLDLSAGRSKRFRGTSGSQIEARQHHVILVHKHVGRFQLPVCFSLSPIARNLLGRDFLNRVQVGFRENHLTFYMAPGP